MSQLDSQQALTLYAPVRQIKDGQIRTYRGTHPQGGSVLVHLVEDRALGGTLEERIGRMPADRRAGVLEVLHLSDGIAVLTESSREMESLEKWLNGAPEDIAPTPPPHFTQLFETSDGQREPAPRDPAPSTESPAEDTPPTLLDASFPSEERIPDASAAKPDEPRSASQTPMWVSRVAPSEMRESSPPPSEGATPAPSTEPPAASPPPPGAQGRRESSGPETQFFVSAPQGQLPKPPRETGAAPPGPKSTPSAASSGERSYRTPSGMPRKKGVSFTQLMQNADDSDDEGRAGRPSSASAAGGIRGRGRDEYRERLRPEPPKAAVAPDAPQGIPSSEQPATEGKNRTPSYQTIISSQAPGRESPIAAKSSDAGEQETRGRKSKGPIVWLLLVVLLVLVVVAVVVTVMVQKG